LDSQIGLQWVDGPSNGGQAVIDYEVWYDKGLDDWALVQANIVSRQHTTTGLQSGTTYKFMVKARNSVGLSAFSAEISILAAQIPDQIQAPVTTISSENV